jgi:hypothetical protein
VYRGEKTAITTVKTSEWKKKLVDEISVLSHGEINHSTMYNTGVSNFFKDSNNSSRIPDSLLFRFIEGTRNELMEELDRIDSIEAMIAERKKQPEKVKMVSGKIIRENMIWVEDIEDGTKLQIPLSQFNPAREKRCEA